VYNLHWDHESQPSRERSARLLLQRLSEDGSPSDALLVLGDFNADEGNAAVRALLADRALGLRNAYRVRDPDATRVGTFHGFRGTPSSGMIDQVLVGRGWTVDAAGIDRRLFGDLWASDHFAVWAVLRRD
jgi:endonuclease/exonuclease/phosphatase family metal-dependent hydrolase